MSSQPNRLPAGGRIDRARPLGFTFNGRRLEGYAGDTLASALLANGVHLVGRSFKYHRPRGIVAAGEEEPNALVQLETGAHTQPNIRATQAELYDGLMATSVNAWPGVRWDMMAVNNGLGRLFPAGFYYKTFMWPRSWWMTYERFIRCAAGLGRAPEEPDPDRYERRNVHCDILVVGGGPAGLAVAMAAGRTGARVLLVDQQPMLGGSLLDRADGEGEAWRQSAVAEIGSFAETTVLTRTAVTGYFDHNFLIACESVTDHLGPDGSAPHLPRLRLWRIRAKRVVLATGAYERAIGFRNNDLPGVMLAGAVGNYLGRQAVMPGRQAVFLTNNDSAYGPALSLAAAGGDVKVADVRAAPGPAADRARAAGIEVLPGHAVTAAAGGRRVRGVTVAALGNDGRPGDGRFLRADLVGMSGGWSPAVHLFSQSRGKLDWRAADACFVPGASAQPCRVVGAANGTFSFEDMLEEAHDVGAGAAEACGFSGAGDAPSLELQGDTETPMMPYWSVPATAKAERKHFIDFQNDVTVGDVRLADREGYRSVEHLKRYTTLGMGTDQGKLGNVPGLALLADAQGAAIPDVGVTTFRPPFTPLSFGAMAGRDRGEFMDPARRTPMHHLHEAAGAVFEDVGQWKRPFYYPQPGEGKAAAVNRECLAARTDAGLLDATTLGKIDLQGPDVAEFLNRIYTNAWSKLGSGALPLWPDARRRRHGDGRRRHLPPRRASLSDDHHHRQRRPHSRVAGGVAANRVAGVACLRKLGDGTLCGSGALRPEGARDSRPADGHRSERRRFPLHELAGGLRRRDPGPGLPHQLLRRAVLRGQRPGELRRHALGGVDGRRAGARPYALRHGSHARPARGKGLHHRRPGHRRHRHAHRSRYGTG